MKVYCDSCKYLIATPSKEGDKLCKFKTIYEDSPVKLIKKYHLVGEKNAKNNCQDYKPCLISRVLTFFTKRTP